MIDRRSRVFIAGHRGMVGSAIVDELVNHGFENLVFKTRQEVDLLDAVEVRKFLNEERPELIIDAAARVGGILANRDYPFEFLIENLKIQNNLIENAHNLGIDNFIFLGSSCIYPKFAQQPIKEEYLLTGLLESTNEPYAIAKIAGLKLCEALRKQYKRNYVALMPTNLYGPRDNFDLMTSHVLPALIRKFHDAKLKGHTPVTLWGTGKPRREFLHVNDLARAVVHLIERPQNETLLNVGTGSDLEIRELALMVQEIIGHQGVIKWDDSRPDGTPRKLLDVSKIHDTGWFHKIGLAEGISTTYEWFLNNLKGIKEVRIQ